MNKVALILSLDYELFGDGSGNVDREQIKPTRQLTELISKYDAKLTIMFEYGQYSAYQKYGNVNAELIDDNKKITDQLIRMIQAGHDVQLHYHAQWHNAQYDKAKNNFTVDLNHVDISSLQYNEIVTVLKEGKEFLEDLLKPYRSDYECVGFRAGSWAVKKQEKLLNALKDSGFKIDSSVVPNTKFESEQVNFEYKDCPHQYKYWYVDKLLCKDSSTAEFIEMPIYTIKDHLASFKYINPKYSLLRKTLKQLYSQKISEKNFSILQKIKKIMTRNYYMADLNTMSYKTLIQMVEKVIHDKENDNEEIIPLMFISHSKISYGMEDLNLFFDYLQKNYKDQVEFWTLQEATLRLSGKNHSNLDVQLIKEPENISTTDLLPILGEKKYLETKSQNYGWLVTDKYILPFFLDKRFIFTRMVFTTGPISKKEGLCNQDEKKFLNKVVDYVKKHKLCDFIYKAQSNVVFNACPKESDCVPWGTYEVDLTRSGEELFNSFDGKSRNVIRKALKEGVEVQSTKDIDLVYQNIKETLERQHSIHYPSREYLEKLQKLKDSAVFLVAMKENTIQGSLILLYDKERGYAMYAGSIISPQTGSLDLLHYEAMKYLQKKNVSMYDFVGTRINIEKGSKQEGIDKFKRKFRPVLIKGYAFRTIIRPLKYSLFTLVSKLYLGLNGYRYTDPISEIMVSDRHVQIKIMKQVFFKMPYFIKFIVLNVHGYLKTKKRYPKGFDNTFKYYMQIDHEEQCQFSQDKFNEQIRENTFYKNKMNIPIEKFPIVNKQFIKNNYEKIINKQEVYLSLYTSGTTGSGLTFPVSKEFMKNQWAVFWKFRTIHDLYINQWMATVTSQSMFDINQAKPPYWIKTYSDKRLVLSAYHLRNDTVKEYIDIIKNNNIYTLHGYPSVLNNFVNLIIENNLVSEAKQIGLKMITTSSEKLFDYQKNKLQSIFGCKIRQLYGLVEGVVNIFECEKGSLHIDESYSYVELIRKEKSNEYRIIGTSYYNKAFPLVRYDTGDTCILHDSDFKCSCGRKSRVVKEILGREEDYLVLSNGNKLGRVSSIFKSLLSIKEAQIYQNKRGSAQFRIIKDKNYSIKDEQILKSQIAEKLGKDFMFEIVYLDNIAKTKSGKLRLVVNENK